ncbi:glycosyl hydrolase family 95 catalytic domain-containing protein [Streptomyces sp. NPDC005151]
MTDLVPTRRAVLGGALGALALGALPAMAGAVPAHAAAPRFPLKYRMDTPESWAAFLGDQDLRWGRVPRTFYEGPFLGNGGLGAAVYTEAKGRLAFTLGDSRVRDHQETGPLEDLSSLFGNARLRIGRLDLVTKGEIVDVDLRLSLFDAELSGTITTSAGAVTLRAFVHATRDLLVVTAEPSDGETVTWEFTPFKAESPRLGFFPRPEGLKDNPAPVVNPGLCEQDLTAGGRTTTAWRVTGGTLLATVAHTFPDRTATERARVVLDRAGDLAALTAEHREWWHAFYGKSFVSVPDARLQSFYWIQLYKIASATRRDLPPVGTCAQWLEPTPWPGTWWNLNVQLEYWLINATGHRELDSLTASLDKYRDNLVLNVPERYRHDSAGLSRISQEDLRTDTLEPAGANAAAPILELGNLTWALHNVWLGYRHTMDDAVLRDVLYPLLRRSINYYLHFLTEGADGRLHLPKTYSPEYGFATDCNYDLALLTWGCRTLLWTVERLGVTDELAPRWREVLDRLVAPPQGPDGLWIGGDRRLTSSHRHFSHLLWFYPMYLLDVNDPANRDLLERSLQHWVGFTGALQGYTFTGASSMSSLLGDGDRALEYLNTLLDRYVKPNTMYAESGPVIETPLAGAQSLHDMVISSWGGVVRVFPAVPSTWDDVAFHNLRAEGAFEVSAVRRGGATAFVRVRSLAGEPCRVIPGGLPGPWEVQRLHDPKEVTYATVNGVLEIDLGKGEEVMIYPAGTRPDTVLGPVGGSYAWGRPAVKRGPSVPVPLDGLLDHDGITWQDALRDGDLGQGYSLPAEEMPAPGPWRSGGVDWVFPSYENGRKNNLVPAGQRVPVPQGRVTNLHVLGLSVGGASTSTVTLLYADGTNATASLKLSDWGQPPQNGEDVAVATTHRHHVTGDHALVVRIFHQWVAVDPARDLVAVQFGANSRMHLLAVSVERPLA